MAKAKLRTNGFLDPGRSIQGLHKDCVPLKTVTNHCPLSHSDPLVMIVLLVIAYVHIRVLNPFGKFLRSHERFVHSPQQAHGVHHSGAASSIDVVLRHLPQNVSQDLSCCFLSVWTGKTKGKAQVERKHTVRSSPMMSPSRLMTFTMLCESLKSEGSSNFRQQSVVIASCIPLKPDRKLSCAFKARL
jgi:hypothetical protein